jgi:hypothetical protein
MAMKFQLKAPLAFDEQATGSDGKEERSERYGFLSTDQGILVI